MSKMFGQVLGLSVMRFISSGIIAIEYAWPIMLALGILHGFWRIIPPAGFLQVVMVMWAARMIIPKVPVKVGEQ